MSHPIPINENHEGIVKPDGPAHQSYIALLNAVRLNPIAHPTPVTHNQPTTKPHLAITPPIASSPGASPPAFSVEPGCTDSMGTGINVLENVCSTVIVDWLNTQATELKRSASKTVDDLIDDN